MVGTMLSIAALLHVTVSVQGADSTPRIDVRLTQKCLVAVCVDGHAVDASAAPTRHDTAFRAMQTRGAAVMGVDQYTSHHVFEDLPDGGRIVLERDDPSDTTGILHIRQHMRDIATAFASGDFTMPFRVHGTSVPGTAVMTARHGMIVYHERDRPRGAEVRILTSDPTALEAVHQFLAFQRQAHRAPGHVPVPTHAP